MASHHNTQLNNGQWNLFFTKFYQLIAIFYIILIVVQLCQASSPSNENMINKYDNLPNEILVSNSPNRFELNRELYSPKVVYYPFPLEFFYKAINDNQYTDPLMERFRKYDPADRSFIRFGRSADATKQIKSKFLKQYINYMKRPAGGDRSFLRFGRSVN